MVKGKTSGLDNTVSGFLEKVLWKIERSERSECLLEGLKETKMPNSALNGITNLIPKPTKDSRRLKNLRPITLPNVDYKILEKAIANRIKLVILVMDSIIVQDQRGFVSNRRIAMNIHKEFEIMDCTQPGDIDALLISIDFEKCFNKIEFEMIFQSLALFEIGQDNQCSLNNL